MAAVRQSRQTGEWIKWPLRPDHSPEERLMARRSRKPDGERPQHPAGLPDSRAPDGGGPTEQADGRMDKMAPASRSFTGGTSDGQEKSKTRRGKAPAPCRPP